MSSVAIAKNTVAILSPCANSVEPKAFQSAMAIAANAGANGIEPRFVGVTERMLVHTARNVLAEGFLKTECEWAFWLDSDMILPANTIPTMISWANKIGAKFLTGIYYQRIGEHKPLVLVRNENVKYEDDISFSSLLPPEGLKTPYKIDACGFGCVLTHRDVFENLAKPYFKYDFVGGKEFSEDFYFCKKAKEAGVQLWAVPELNCGHIGEAPIITKKDCAYKGKVVPMKVEAAEMK